MDDLSSIEVKNSHMVSELERKIFEDDTCFLCHVPLTKENRSQEHVFPKWLQNMHNLWNERLILINGTMIFYKDIKVPCCKTCNGIHLAGLELEVERVFTEGFESVSQFPQLRLFQWLSKILYCLIRKSSMLPLSRRDINSENLISEKVLAEYRNLRFFLSSVKKNINFDRQVWSMQVVKLEDPSFYFFADDITNLSITLAINGVGILTCLQDNGIYNEVCGGCYTHVIKAHSLNHIQFKELIAKMFYKNSLRTAQSKYFLQENLADENNPIIVTAILPPTSQVYSDWNNSAYTIALEYFTGVELGEPGNDQCYTFMDNLGI